MRRADAAFLLASLGLVSAGFTATSFAKKAMHPPPAAVTELAAGYIPLFLDPQAGRVLLIGEARWTGSALARSRRVFSLSTVADRGALRAHPDRYDIIEAGLSEPWSRDELLAAGLQLAPRGVFCRRLMAPGTSLERFRAELADFASAFPHVLLFRAGSMDDYLMVGTNQSWDGSSSTYGNAIVDESPALRAGLARLDLAHTSREGRSGSRIGGPFELLAGEFVLDDGAFRQYASRTTSQDDSIYRSLESARKEEFPPENFPDKLSLDETTVRTVVGAACASLGDTLRARRLAASLASLR